MILDKRTLLFSIIFCIFVFLISICTLNKFITDVMNENGEEQLLKANAQNSELGKVRIETVLDNKMDIFIENVLASGSMENNKIDDVKIVEFIKRFRKENFIEIMGVIGDGKAIFINDNDERMTIDEKTIYAILLEEKKDFQIFN